MYARYSFHIYAQESLDSSGTWLIEGRCFYKLKEKSFVQELFNLLAASAFPFLLLKPYEGWVPPSARPCAEELLLSRRGTGSKKIPQDKFLAGRVEWQRLEKPLKTQFLDKDGHV